MLLRIIFGQKRIADGETRLGSAIDGQQIDHWRPKFMAIAAIASTSITSVLDPRLKFIFIARNSIRSIKSLVWWTRIRSLAAKVHFGRQQFDHSRKIFILIHFDRNRRASEVQGRMPTCPQGPGQKALHQRGLRRFPRFSAKSWF